MKIKYWLPAVIVMILIFAFSSLPELRVQQISNPGTAVLDKTVRQVANTPKLKVDWLKVGHFIGYALLGAAFCLAYLRGSRARRPFSLSLLSSFLYSLTDEFHQLFVPGRSCRYQDVLIDTSAAALAILCILIAAKKRKAPNS